MGWQPGRTIDWEQLEKAAYDAWDREDWRTAAARFEELLAVLPDGEKSPAWWSDAALAYKFLREWSKAYELGRQAAARSPRGEQDPAFWNLGIAATVMRDWATAREAWIGYGIDLQSGEGEIAEDFGMTLIRLDPAGEPETVWARRICPTRARIVSVPMASERRFGEIVLHDGTPNGERIVEERRYPVFDEILLWAPSSLPTLTVTLTANSPDDVVELLRLFEDNGLGAEPQSGLQILCACCSEGSVEQERHVEAGSQTIWLAAPAHEAEALLDRWRSRGDAGRSWTGLALAHTETG
jgi:hypothetical protein